MIFNLLVFGQSKWNDHLNDYEPYTELQADFPLIQSFPYNHKQKPTLTVHSRTKGIILNIGEGQILNKSKVKIQFGATGDINEWDIKQPSDGTTSYFFIVNEREFMRKLRLNSVLRISILLYQNGEQTIYFNTQGFKL
jgi:hypothetical protein